MLFPSSLQECVLGGLSHGPPRTWDPLLMSSEDEVRIVQSIKESFHLALQPGASCLDWLAGDKGVNVRGVVRRRKGCRPVWQQPFLPPTPLRPSSSLSSHTLGVVASDWLWFPRQPPLGIPSGGAWGTVGGLFSPEAPFWGCSPLSCLGIIDGGGEGGP